MSLSSRSARGRLSSNRAVQKPSETVGSDRIVLPEAQCRARDNLRWWHFTGTQCHFHLQMLIARTRKGSVGNQRDCVGYANGYYGCGSPSVCESSGHHAHCNNNNDPITTTTITTTTTAAAAAAAATATAAVATATITTITAAAATTTIAAAAGAAPAPAATTTTTAAAAAAATTTVTTTTEQIHKYKDENVSGLAVQL